MSPRSASRWLVLLALSAAGVAAVAFALRRPRDPKPVPAPIVLEPTPAETAEVRNESPGFRDETPGSGITFRMLFLPGEQGEKFKTNLYDHGCGVAVADYNGDGYDDIYLLNQLGPNALYRNRGNGTFVDVTAEAGVGVGDRICVGATFGDDDNDGDQDLYVTSTRGGNLLFQNQGNGTFRDVTEQAGLTYVAHSQTAAFFDYDNDGYLDLFVTNSAQWTTDNFNESGRYFLGPNELAELAACPPEYNVLYHNNRDGTFSDVTEQVGLRGKGWSGDVAIFDFDEDGKLDLFVTNMFGLGQLCRDQGDGTYRDVAKEVLKRTSWGMAGCKAFDINNDGHLDLLITDMHSDMWMPPRYESSMVEMIITNEGKKYEHVTGPIFKFSNRWQETEDWFVGKFGIVYDDVVFGNTLFKNLGGGQFEEVSDAANMETFWPWGIASGDFDNDGYEDVFLPSGMGHPFFYWRNYLMMNNRDGTFSDRSRTEGIDPPAGDVFLEKNIGGRRAARSSRCAAAADFDGDGRLELIVNNFNDYPYYLKNQFAQQNYVAFRLRGSTSNRDAIGALVTLHTGDDVMVRQVHAAGGYLSQSSKTLHFGLADRSKIDRVEIRWPSGVRQEIVDPAINTLHDVVEP